MWMVGLGALRGASLCRRIKRRQWGANGWLRAGTKRGAGSVRRARIQILSGKMSPLSVGYIAGGGRELAQQKLSISGQDLDTHHGLRALPLDCSIPPLKWLWSIWSRSGISVTVANRWSSFTHGRAEAVEARGRGGDAPGAVRGAGGALDGKRTASSWWWCDAAAAPRSALFSRSLPGPGVPWEVSVQLCPAGLPLLSGGAELQEREGDPGSTERRWDKVDPAETHTSRHNYIFLILQNCIVLGLQSSTRTTKDQVYFPLIPQNVAQCNHMIWCLQTVGL